ncbi:hypothetical protein Drorol1_Dr00024696 [Drosera rotundifolia]
MGSHFHYLDGTDFSFNFKRKTPSQLHQLQVFYSEDKYPTQKRFEYYACVLGLTYQQVRGWFVERHRKDKNDVESRSAKGHPHLGVKFGAFPSTLGQRQWDSESSHDASQDGQVGFMMEGSEPFISDLPSAVSAPAGKRGMGKDLMTVWRLTNPDAAHTEAPKRRKVLSNSTIIHAKKHGMGKALMTVWKVMHPNAGKFHELSLSSDMRTAGISQLPSYRQQKSTQHRRTRKQPVSKQRKSGIQPKKKPPQQRRKLESNNNNNLRKTSKDKCELSIAVERSQVHLTAFASLVDDEELELREQRAGTDLPSCSSHFSTNEKHACSLCKGLLAKFPPNFVRKKRPLLLQPWSSSGSLVKMLLKVFQFLYSYAVVAEIPPFTLDEFAQAFSDKESLLLGKIHVCLLELLFSNVENELSNGLYPCRTENCMFRNLLQSVEDKKFDLNFWKKSINPLTWTEILRQVSTAAGFGSKSDTCIKGGIEKEENLMDKYGICPGSLKGVLFSTLMELGNKGTSVSEISKSPQIVNLGFTDTVDELEQQIGSTLASDIRLFEKISPSAYRLRLNSLASGDEDCYSDAENSGGIDESLRDGGACNSDDSVSCHCEKDSMSSPCTEIDESLPGEAWLSGLMEGEYSDLTIEEKLKILMALIDLLSSGSTITMEEPVAPAAAGVPKVYQHGSGAKIKRSSVTHAEPSASDPRNWQVCVDKECPSQAEDHTVDSSTLMSLFRGKNKSSPRSRDAKETAVGDHLHPMQSIFLGSDRRYNRYWLFLGPCVANDPGHRRVYFESSEDGHWEVIDTEEALCALLRILDKRGRREAALMALLYEVSVFLFEEMARSTEANAHFALSSSSDLSELDGIHEDRSSPVSDVDNSFCLNAVSHDTIVSSTAEVLEVRNKAQEQKEKWIRLQAYDSWIWDSFCSHLHSYRNRRRFHLDSLTRCRSCHDLYWRDEKHCKICHTTFELDFDLEEKYVIHAATCQEKEDRTCPSHKVFPSHLQALKAAIHTIESAMPETAMIGSWIKSAHKLWVRRLRRTSSLAELIQVISDFVNAMNVDWQPQCSSALRECDDTLQDIVASFSNLPQTTSAIALWLVKLDTLIAVPGR